MYQLKYSIRSVQQNCLWSKLWSRSPSLFFQFSEERTREEQWEQIWKRAHRPRLLQWISRDAGNAGRAMPFLGENLLRSHVLVLWAECRGQGTDMCTLGGVWPLLHERREKHLVRESSLLFERYPSALHSGKAPTCQGVSQIYCVWGEGGECRVFAMALRSLIKEYYTSKVLWWVTDKESIKQLTLLESALFGAF